MKAHKDSLPEDHTVKWWRQIEKQEIRTLVKRALIDVQIKYSGSLRGLLISSPFYSFI